MNELSPLGDSPASGLGQEPRRRLRVIPLPGEGATAELENLRSTLPCDTPAGEAW